MAAVLAVFVVMVIALAVLGLVLRRFLIVCPPNRLLVLSGRPRRLADGQMVGYRLVFGGRVVRIPILEQAHWLDLTSMMVEVKLADVYTNGGVPVDFDSMANVKIESSEPAVVNAVERFLGKSREEILRVARETIEGLLRTAVARLSVDELRTEPDALHNAVFTAGDLERLGLRLDTLKVGNILVRSDRPMAARAASQPAETRRGAEASGPQEPPVAPAVRVASAGPGPSGQGAHEVEDRSVPDLAELARLADPALSPDERDRLMETFVGRRFDLTMDVEDVTYTTAADLPDAYRGGQTVVGKAYGTLGVAVSFPKDRDQEARALRRGAALSVEVRIVRWDPLFRRLATAAV